MQLLSTLILSSLAAASPSQSQKPSPPSKPSTLWATHYNGNVYTLSLSGDSLSLASAQKTCGDMPSWLTFDAASRTVYCSDESGTAAGGGSLTAYRASRNGTLHQFAKTETVGGGVNSVLYEAEKGKFLGIAHYEGSAVSTFSLPLSDNQEALQEFHFNMTHQGTTAQQDSPHPHGVFIDPTGSFLVSPDLGADLVRVYSIDEVSGKLRECPSLEVPLGTGPRHSVFWTDGSDHDARMGGSQSSLGTAGDKTMMYLANEIGGSVMVFDVAYSQDGCLSFNKKQTLVPYTNGTMPEGATPAEIRMVNNAIYVSIRTDQGFAPSDSMVTLSRAPSNGAIKLRDRTSAYGKVPRTFVINQAGDLVAIGNQASAMVVIVRRDPATGKLIEKVAELQVGEPGKVGSAEGLSSVIWAE
ncbi:Cytochrome cd1-nitrite reductase-like C-terminal heme d1 [Penicillium macrosclerotiorum]|uniref:Cytochrome cd1-nitrite reductase-like C-terminal heme d1 n=1 Tax=Penicillium macrosclerotiorum TaxID=303699 RepID=UPI002549B1EF|nr:Cytochrome cd1-nitrite reductase-like C-terminal heme d1 [Penicillium macrosclerotiorum]KAJ5662677.1 Cytochrome cd1-nitrite reductase-like C-terminal heme d1 [Penicillium macrosclerotiorum]